MNHDSHCLKNHDGSSNNDNNNNNHSPIMITYLFKNPPDNPHSGDGENHSAVQQHLN